MNKGLFHLLHPTLWFECWLVDDFIGSIHSWGWLEDRLPFHCRGFSYFEVRGSRSSLFLLFFCESFFLIGCIEMEFQILLWATGGPLLAFHVVLLH